MAMIRMFLGPKAERREETTHLAEGEQLIEKNHMDEWGNCGDYWSISAFYSKLPLAYQYNSMVEHLQANLSIYLINELCQTPNALPVKVLEFE